MLPKVLCFLVLLEIALSTVLRNHEQQVKNQEKYINKCKKVQKRLKSFNNNCEFRYTTCQYSSSQILQLKDCTYCEGQKNCPYLKYLEEVQCIQKCCPFQSFFLSSMSHERLQSCIGFTQMQQKTMNWMHNQFLFPFLIALIVLLIIIVIFLLVKTAIHLWHMYVKKMKRNQNHNDQNHDNTTQQNQRLPGWVYEH